MSKHKQNDAPKKPFSLTNVYASMEWAKLSKDEKKGVNYTKWQSTIAKIAWDALDDENEKPYIEAYNQRLKVYNDYIKENGKPEKKKKIDNDVPKNPSSSFVLFTNNLREVHKDDKSVDKTIGPFSKFASTEWHKLGIEGQKEWQDLYAQKRAEYDEYVKLNGKPNATGFGIIRETKHIRCPFDQLSPACGSIWRHIQRVHFPDRKSDTNVGQMYTDLCNSIKQNETLANDYHERFLKFWATLFKQTLGEDEQQKIGQLKEVYDELMNAGGKRGNIYVLSKVTDPSKLNCPRQDLIQFFNYLGEHSELGEIRHFIPSKLSISGEVGRQIGQAVVDKTPTYSWIAVESVPEVSLLTLEQCMIGALMSLNHDQNFLWNINLNALPVGHKLRKESPDLLVNVGLYTLRLAIDRLHSSFADSSFFKNKEIINLYYNAFTSEQRDAFDRSYRIGKYKESELDEEENQDWKAMYEQMKQERDSERERANKLEEELRLLKAQIASGDANFE